MKRPDWTYLGWWRWKVVDHLRGEDLPTKLKAEEFGGGRYGNFLLADEISQYMCSVKNCGARAHASWSGCADENINRPLCPEHDVQINLLALFWWGDPRWEDKIKEYVEGMEKDIGRSIQESYYSPDSLARQLLEKINQGEAT